MTTSQTPTETLDAIAVFRANAEVQRAALLTERRSLSSRVLIGDPAARTRVTQLYNDLRELDGALEDMEEPERQALAAIAEKDRLEREARRIAIFYNIEKALNRRNAVSDEMEANLAGFKAGAREFDDLSAEIAWYACEFGRPETIGFLTPPAADQLLLNRLVAMQSLPAVATNGRIVFHETIDDISRTAGERLLGHLVEFLPPDKRPLPAAVKDTPKKDKRKAKAAPVQELDEDFVDDLPPLEEI